MPDIWKLMRAIRRSGLTAPERHTLLTLTTLIDPKTGLIPERFQPSLTDLQRFTGLGRSTIVRSLNVAEDTGWLKRTVPTKQAARKNKEKTSYLLSIPPSASADEDEDPAEASATAGLVPQRDQPEGWSQSGPSATAGLELVPQRDQASARAGHKELNHVNQPEPSPPTEERTRDTANDPGALFSVPGQRNPSDEASPEPPPARSSQRKRLSRVITKNNEPLPADWHVSPEMVEWARKETPNVGRFATDKFIEHFSDGQKGKELKKDWDKAWRNWMRTDQERFEERTGIRGPVPVNGPGTALDRVDDNGRRTEIRSPADERLAAAVPLYEKYKRQELAEQETARG